MTSVSIKIDIMIHFRAFYELKKMLNTVDVTTVDCNSDKWFKYEE